MATQIAAEPFLTVEQVRESDRCAECMPPSDPSGDALIERWIDEASDLIATVTAMRVAGQMDVIARPCRTGMLCDCLCHCCHLDSIPLGDQKPTITQVKINGEVVPATDYDLHWGLNGWNLVRLGDGTRRPPNWPSNQDRWRPDDQDRTFAIYMTVGVPVDHTLIENAMLEIICGWAKGGANAGGNTLARGITRAQLGGTTVDVDAVEGDDGIEPGTAGPALTELLGVLAPTGRETTAVYAPELAMGWELGLRPAS